MYLKLTAKPLNTKAARTLLVVIVFSFAAHSALSQCAVDAGNDTAVCINEPLALTATATGGTVLDFAWASIPSSTPFTGNPFNVQTSVADTFTYEVTATFQDGCSASDTIEIIVHPYPVADFSFAPADECSSTPVSFTNTSSGIGLSYSWNFGDPNSGAANTSTSTNPVHRFVGTPGTGTQSFTVTLIVTSSTGCKDTITQQVTTKQTPGMKLGGTGETTYNGLNYFTTCSTSATANFDFTNQSSTESSNVSYTLVWGDGSPDFTAPNFSAVSHTYLTGNYTLLFIVQGGAPNSCPDTATYYVFVGSNPAVGLNNPGNTTVCSGVPLTFPISGTSTNPPGTTYTVTLNDAPTVYSFVHPAPAGVTHAFTQTSCGTTSSDGSNIYPNSFSAVIVASNPCGNSSSGVVPIYVSQRPEASFSISPNDTACVNHPVTFTNTSISGNTVQNGLCTPGKAVWSISPSTGWTISAGSLGNSFGLNDPATWLAGSNILRINFTSIGTYTIKLKTGGSTHCANDSIEQTICVNQIPVAAFSIDQNEGCSPVTVATTNGSSASFCGPNIFRWTISYLPIAGCSPATRGYTYINGTDSTSEHPQIRFTNPGIYTLNLTTIAPGMGCSSQVVSRQVTVRGKPSLTLSPLASICQNQSISPALIAGCFTSNATYAWTFVSGSPAASGSSTPGTITYNTPGTFDVSVDVTNECGTTTAVQPITVNTVTTADAGPTQILCGSDVTMAANPAVIGTGAWSYVSGPSGYTITSISSPTTTVTGLLPGNYIFRWTITNGICVSSSDVSITIVPGPTPPLAGPDQAICLASSTSLSANTPALGAGLWSIVSGPPGASFTDPSSPATTVSGLVPGTYIFRWTISFANCSALADDVQVTIYADPSVADAGVDQVLCTSSASMGANIPTIGTGSWSFVNGPNVPIIADPNLPGTAISGLIPGIYQFRWTIANGPCVPSEDLVQLDVTPFPTPANAGPDQTICAATLITLAGNAPSIGNGIWAFVSGPSSPVITDPAVPAPLVSGLVPGIYAFEWTISNGVCPASRDTVLFTINDNVTVADAGPAQEKCGNTVTMAGNIPVIGTGLWSFVSGPSGSVITSPDLPATTVTGLVPGTYVFQWTITNGSCSSSSNVTVTMYSSPTPADAGADQDLCLATTTSLAANVPAVGTGAWSIVSGPAGASIADPLLATTSISGLVPGTYIFRWTTNFSNCSPSTDDVRVTIFENPTVAIAGPDQVICATGATMAANTALVGTGLWSLVSGPNSPVFTDPSSPASGVTGLLPGTYVFRWRISNGACNATEDIVQVEVTPAPTTANAGPDQTLCSASNATLNANTPLTGNGSWAIISGPAGATITSPGSPTTTVTGLVPGGNYVFEWSISNGVCPSSRDQVQLINLQDLQNQVSAPVTTICSGQMINIHGDIPTGGTGLYAYQWESSPDGISGWTSVPGATTQNYSATLNGPMCFRRKVSSLPCETVSNVICINVQPSLANNSISADQSICINTAAAGLVGSLPVGGDGIYSYQWQLFDGSNWNDITGATDINYNPGVLTQTAIFRRVVSTSLCNGSQASVSNTVTISVNQDAEAAFNANPTIACAPFNLSNAINVTPFPDRNGSYHWYADGDEIPGSPNSTGVFPGFIINSPGDTVDIKLVTVSQHGCLPDSITIQFITHATAVANFNKSQASGCGPLTVQFTNTSSILNASTQYFWDFGNGSVSTDMQPGPVVYQNSPLFKDTTYYIRLKAFNGCDTTSFTDSVKILPDSKARFSVDTTRGCSPFTVHINNISGGNNTAYYWDFGNGIRDTSYATGPFTYTYYTGALATYTLTLISENQCSRDTQSIDIVVSPNSIQPAIAANGNQVSGCAPHLVVFNNSSAGATLIDWNFGDNNQTTTPGDQDTVVHQYNSPGTYTVTIHLRNDCSDTTIQRTITVYAPPVASFDVAPLKICTNQSVAATNNSTNADSYQWFWGDATSSAFINGQHVYSAPGDYTIALVARKVYSAGFTCTDTTRKQVTVVDKIPAQISVPPGNACVPYDLQASAGSIPGYSLVEWFVYDSSRAPGIFHFTGLNASYQYTKPGSYSVKLVVHTTSGCLDSARYHFVVHPTPVTSFTPINLVTCSHDTTVSFLATALNAGNEPVSYQWFVDGNPEGSANPFSYRFQADPRDPSPVEFTIQALGRNAAGCGDSSAMDRLVIQPLPWPAIRVSPGLVQFQPDYTFDFTDTVATHINKTYHWDLGDRNLQTRDGRDITYTYSDVGAFNVKLEVKDFNTGCSARDSVIVTVLFVQGSLYIPNAFYPNSRINELKTFKPIGIGLETYHLQVFDAWGKLVFETRELNADGSPKDAWDGKYAGNGQSNGGGNKPMAQDAYVWKIVEAKFKNGKDWEGMSYNGGPPKRIGTVTLFR